MIKTTMAVMECGCRVVETQEYIVGEEIKKDMLIEYCPKHKAAPDMYEALISFRMSFDKGNIEMEGETRELLNK